MQIRTQLIKKDHLDPEATKVTSRFSFWDMTDITNNTVNTVYVVYFDEEGKRFLGIYSPFNMHTMSAIHPGPRTVKIENIVRAGQNEILKTEVSLSEEELLIGPIFVEKIGSWVCYEQHLSRLNEMEDVRRDSYTTSIKRQIMNFKNTIHVFFQLTEDYYLREKSKHLLMNIGGMEYLTEAIQGDTNKITIVFPKVDASDESSLTLTFDVSDKDVEKIIQGEITSFCLKGYEYPVVIGLSKFRKLIAQESKKLIKNILLDEHQLEVKTVEDQLARIKKTHADEVSRLKQIHEEEIFDLKKDKTKLEVENERLNRQLDLIISEKKTSVETDKIRHTKEILEEKNKQSQAATKRENYKILPTIIAAVASVISSVVVIWKIFK